MPGIELVVTDLDGTLWHTDDDLHPLTVAALAELQHRGVPLLVATGRRLTSTRAPLARFGLTPPAVVLNGAVALDLATGRRFHRRAFSPEDASRVLDAFFEAGVEPCVYVDDEEVEVYVGDAPSTHPDHLRALGPSSARADLAKVTATVPVLAFGVIGAPHDLLEPAAVLVAAVAKPYLSRSIDYGGAALTVAPNGLSKWVGVLAYCALAGVDPGQVLAIGDGSNDLELLSNARIAVTLVDGDPLLLPVAHHVVPAAREGGWASLIDLV